MADTKEYSNGSGKLESDDFNAPDLPYNGKFKDQEQALGEKDDDDDGFKQHGVKRIEAISSVWTTSSLVICYVAVYFLANATSLEGIVTSSARNYATSSFQLASLVSTIGVVQAIVLSVWKPPIAKIADVWGRSEAFTISVALLTLGYILQASAHDLNTFAAAQVIYSAGSTGVQLLIQIFVADTSNLLNRALFSSIPDLPYLWTTWAGPQVVGGLVNPITGEGWEWCYGMWAIIVPVCFIPLALSLFYNQRKANRMGIMPPSPLKGNTILGVIGKICLEIDAFGLILFSASISLILLPLTLYKTAVNGFHNPSMIAMVVVGCVLLPIFIFWERSEKLAPYAFFPKELFQKKTVLAGLGIGFFYFMAFYLSVFPYFFTYLIVVRNMSIEAAGNVTNVFNFSSSVTSFVVSFFIKYTGHYKYFITFGACIYLLGFGVMYKYRQSDTSDASIIGTQIAIGIGGGMLNVPAQLGVQAACNSHQEVALATAVFLTLVEVGGAVGNAVAGSIWPETILPRMQALLPPETRGMASTFLNSYEAVLVYPLGTPTRTAISLAFQHGMDVMMIVCLCICVPIILLSLVMENYKLAELNQKVKGRVVGGREEGRRESVMVRRGWKFWKK